ncbi:MAG: DUF58 domain-containing protein [Pseudomonadota bacterium]
MVDKVKKIRRIKSEFPLLSRTGVLLLATALAVAAWFGYSGPAALIGLVLAAAGISRAWSFFCLYGVDCRRSITPSRAFPGETVELEIIFENRKILPVPWLEVDDELPRALAPAGEEALPGPDPSRVVLRMGFRLQWYDRVRRSHRLECRKRGYYRLGPAVLRSGDVFGFYREEKEILQPDFLIVYPVVHALERFLLPSRNPLGESGSPNPLFEDPSLPVGLKPYTPDAPFKYIHWKSSARGRDLQVKVFEPSASQKVLIFLDPDGFEDNGDDFEWAVSLTASLANRVIEQGHSAGCLVNSRAGNDAGTARIPPGAGLDHLAVILEALAKVEARASLAFEDFFDAEKALVAWGTTVCLVCRRLTEGQAIRLEDLTGRGFETAVFVVGPEIPVAAGLNCRRVLGPDDLGLDLERAAP